MQLSFSLLAVATAFAAAPALLVSAHPAQQLKRVTTTIKTPPPTPTSTIALRDAGIPTHASTVTDALPAAIKTTPPSSCTFCTVFFFSSPPHPFPTPALSFQPKEEAKKKMFPIIIKRQSHSKYPRPFPPWFIIPKFILLSFSLSEKKKKKKDSGFKIKYHLKKPFY